MISIVIPYMSVVASGQQDEELRHVLRAWEEHAGFDFEIILVGDKPKWYTGRYVPTSKVRGIPFARSFDIANKIKTICGSDLISNDFIYTYDDVFTMSRVTLEDIGAILAENRINKRNPLKSLKGDASRKWQTMFSNTVDCLMEIPELYNYETHLPRILNKNKLSRIYEDFSLDKEPLLFSTLYYNQYHEPDLILHSKHPYRVWVGKGSEKYVEHMVSDRVFMNYTGNDWKGGIQNYVINRYNKPSIYEHV